MRILAFDQAFIRTGWAFGSDSGASHCGEIHIPAGRFDSLGSRLLKFERAVAELMDQHKPDLIAFEAHRGHSAVQAAQVLGAVSMSIMKMPKSARSPTPELRSAPSKPGSPAPAGPARR